MQCVAPRSVASTRFFVNQRLAKEKACPHKQRPLSLHVWWLFKNPIKCPRYIPLNFKNTKHGISNQTQHLEFVWLIFCTVVEAASTIYIGKELEGQEQFQVPAKISNTSYSRLASSQLQPSYTYIFHRYNKTTMQMQIPYMGAVWLMGVKCRATAYDTVSGWV